MTAQASCARQDEQEQEGAAGHASQLHTCCSTRHDGFALLVSNLLLVLNKKENKTRY